MRRRAQVAALGLALLIGGAQSAISQHSKLSPAPIVRVGATEKICQLTGDVDWQTGRPTAARTFSNFGLAATFAGQLAH